MGNGDVLQYFWQAGGVVKCVLLILVAASIISWTFIFQRRAFYKKVQHLMHKFDAKIWKTKDLTAFFQEVKKTAKFHAGIEHIFLGGFSEFLRVRKIASRDRTFIMESAERAMKVAHAKEVMKLEKNLSVLASIGSVSPYVGLFGTVWGIMSAFSSLSEAQQVTIAMVAPGIAEALVATAIGLFAAIPAVLAYNFFSNRVNQIAEEFEQFEDRFSLLLHQALYSEINTSYDEMNNEAS